MLLDAFCTPHAGLERNEPGACHIHMWQGAWGAACWRRWMRPANCMRGIPNLKT